MQITLFRRLSTRNISAQAAHCSSSAHYSTHTRRLPLALYADHPPVVGDLYGSICALAIGVKIYHPMRAPPAWRIVICIWLVVCCLYRKDYYKHKHTHTHFHAVTVNIQF